MNLIQSVNKLDYLKFGEKETWWQKSCEKKKTIESKWWQNKWYQSFAFNENML